MSRRVTALLIAFLVTTAGCAQSVSGGQSGDDAITEGVDPEEQFTGSEMTVVETEPVPDDPDGPAESCTVAESYEEPPAETGRLKESPEEAFSAFVDGSLEAYRSRPDTLLPGQELLSSVRTGAELTDEDLNDGAEGLITVAMAEESLLNLQEAEAAGAVARDDDSGGIGFSTADDAAASVTVARSEGSSELWWVSGFTFGVLPQFCGS